MTNWPDPARPGVPLAPNIDGWHWLVVNRPGWTPRLVQWFAADQAWDGRVVGQTEGWTYLGPCLPMADVSAILRALEKQGTLLHIIAVLEEADNLRLSVAAWASARAGRQEHIAAIDLLNALDRFNAVLEPRP